MLRGLWRLTWLEILIFAREPLGLVGTIAVPVVVFVVLARIGGAGARLPADAPPFLAGDLPILAAILIAASAVLSLVTIIAIYREGGILKRLRATPLRPHTILAAQVIVRLLFTLVTLAVLALAGRRYIPPDADVPYASFALALLLSTASVIALGFLVASLVPTARFAQPVATLVVYPMIGLSGLFVPVEAMPPFAQVIARLLPFTYAVSLLRGMWHGASWASHAGDVAALLVMLAVLTALSSRVFRWE